MIIDTDGMNFADEIFEALKSGRHLSTDNGSDRLWHAYNERREEWEALFAMIGYTLERHESGFCYLETAGTTNSNAAGITAFMILLVRDIYRNHDGIENTLLTETWHLDSLPHLNDDRGRAIMKQVQVTTPADLKDLARKIAKLGFATTGDDGTIRFHKPVRRFLDMCISAYEKSGEEKERIKAAEARAEGETVQ